MNHPKHAAKVWLIDTVPHEKAGPRARPQHTLEFTQGAFNIAKKHDAEAGCCQIKAVVRERQLMRIRALSKDIAQPVGLRTSAGNLKQVRTQVRRSDLSFGPNAPGKSDGRLPSTACQ